MVMLGVSSPFAPHPPPCANLTPSPLQPKHTPLAHASTTHLLSCTTPSQSCLQVTTLEILEGSSRAIRHPPPHTHTSLPTIMILHPPPLPFTLHKCVHPPPPPHTHTHHVPFLCPR